MSDWFDILRPLLAGAVAAVVVGALARLGARAAPDRNGWHRVVPSPMHWFGLLGSAVFAGLVLYVRLFVGSARADAEEQMMWATLLAAGFAAATLYTLWQIGRINRANVAWRGATLCFTAPGGVERTRAMTDVAGIDRRWTGTVAIHFFDGQMLELDEYARGARELCERIIEVNDEPAKG